jgi:hypothetical protein
MGAWLAAFAFTQAVEAPLYAAALRGRRGRWAWALAASALTHPVVWFVFPRVWPGGYGHQVLAAEAFAVTAEAVWLGALGVPRAAWWALAANGLSAGLGLASRAAFGWP